MRPILFYDGDCGLCHRAVLFTLKRDRQGLLAFAPLRGETVTTLVDEAARTSLPDSLVLREPEGVLRVKSAAVVALLKRLGFFWRLLGAALWIIPRPVRDFGYDLVAKVRHRLFAKPAGACPIVPKGLRDRFLP